MRAAVACQPDVREASHIYDVALIDLTLATTYDWFIQANSRGSDSSACGQKQEGR